MVIKDGFKEISRSLERLLQKVAKIVAHIRKSQHATEMLEGERRVQVKNATRWNSELTSIKSILRVPEDKLNSLDTVHLTTYERKMLEDLVKLLSPFQEATNLTQGQNVITSSFILPCVRGLRKSLDSLSRTHTLKLIDALKTSLDTRLAKYEDQEKFQLASTLDPRFKLKWCIDESEKKGVQQKLVHCVANNSENTCLASAQVTDKRTSCDPPPTKKTKPRQLLKFMFDESESASTDKSNLDSVKAEVLSYLSTSCLDEGDNPLIFWKINAVTYPALAALAKRYLSIPASSGPVERLFSIGGKIFRPDRCRITDDKFEKLMNIKCNSHL